MGIFKKIILYFSGIFIIGQFIYADLNIVERIKLKVSIDRNGLSKFINDDPPIYIIEGQGGELIVPRSVYFEVFSKGGEKVKKIGDRGEGPGAFITILSIKKYSSLYYIHDYLDKISIYDKDYNYINRSLLLGPRCSNFFYDFYIHKNEIYCSQKCQKSDNIEHSIAVYSETGKFKNHFLIGRLGKKISLK